MYTTLADCIVELFDLHERFKFFNVLLKLWETQKGLNSQRSSRTLHESLLCKLRDPASTWEAKHGCLLAVKLLLVHKQHTDAFLEDVKDVAVGLLTDDEVRVRLGAGEK